jgi:hypothetical protein
MPTSEFKPTNSVKHYFDPVSNRNLYRVLAADGVLVAEGIDSESIDRQIACLDQLVEGYELLLGHAERDFWGGRYDLRWPTPCYEELAADQDGSWEAQFPGISLIASLLLETNEIKDYLDGLRPEA